MVLRLDAAHPAHSQFAFTVMAHIIFPALSVQTVLDQLLEAPVLGHERVSGDGLLRRVARPYEDTLSELAALKPMSKCYSPTWLFSVSS
jgi:hypothetical protein